MSSSADDAAAALERVRQLEADEEYARKVWQRDSDRQQRRAERSQRQERFFGTQQGPDGMIVPTDAVTSPAANDEMNGVRRSDRAEPYNPFRDPALVNVDASARNQSSNDVPRMLQDVNGEEKQWNTKEIYWNGRSQRIIVQNENGPCSLIALCNILLLRGTLTITPEDRPAVSYSYLSSLLGEHVLDVTSTQSNAAIDLEAALSILPQMQSGLDVNVQFSSIHGFAGQALSSPDNGLNGVEQGLDLIDLSEPGPSRAAQKSTSAPAAKAERGELALFKACQVSLVHGWLADNADVEVWDAVVNRAGDYDTALDRIVAGDELTKGLIGQTDPSQETGSSSQTAQLSDEDRTTAAMTTLPDEQKRVVSDALLVRRFLESTATQLTYPGLHALSTTLARGELYALFRNSHLSVLYRPTEEELALALGQDESGGAFSHGQPQLYQLVTDATLEIEDGIVWESIEDVDGSASRFFDGKFRPTRLQGDFVGQPEHGIVNEDADFAYAQHLQQQEQMRAERHRRQQHERRQQLARSHRRQQSQQHTNNESQGLIARMLAKRKSSKNAPSPSELNANVDDHIAGRRNAETTPPLVTFAEPGQSTPPPPSAAQQQQTAQNGSKKWWKKVF